MRITLKRIKRSWILTNDMHGMNKTSIVRYGGFWEASNFNSWPIYRPTCVKFLTHKKNFSTNISTNQIQMEILYRIFFNFTYVMDLLAVLQYYPSKFFVQTFPFVKSRWKCCQKGVPSKPKNPRNPNPTNSDGLGMF